MAVFDADVVCGIEPMQSALKHSCQVAVHRGIYVSSARTAAATNEERLVLHGAVPHLYPRRAA
jgi:hypothetical protein